jgi:hypothetical protein
VGHHATDFDKSELTIQVESDRALRANQVLADNMDPSASAPFVAMLVGVTGIAIYFTVAATVPRGTSL